MTPAFDWGEATDESTIETGAWRLTRRGSELCDISYDDVPVLRAIRFVTRDHDWRTADDTVLTIRELPADSGLQIDASSGYDGAETLRYRLDALVSRDTLRVSARATVVSSFLRNRVGLVVLHPPALAGTELTVQHPNGSETLTAYPDEISPHQPAIDVTGLAWEADGVATALTLTGDVFEMEDQRNWTDASYKTYSTPLSDPFPVSLSTGDEIIQTVTIRCSRSGRHRTPSERTRSEQSTALVAPAPAPALVATAPAPAWPVLQVLASSAPATDRPNDALVHTERPVLVEPQLDQPNWRSVLASARRDAGSAPLDIRFVTDDPKALRDAISAAMEDGPIVRVGAYHPQSHITTIALQCALVAAQQDGLPADLVAGARTHFTELNRTIDEFVGWDHGLSFSVTPQMHDRSRAQVEESIGMQRVVATNARRLAGSRPLHIGPVTLRPRLNAVATSQRRAEPAELAHGYGPQFVPDATDPAQGTDAAAKWFLASIAALSVDGVASITLCEAWGPRGLVSATGRTPTASALGLLP